ncbi:MAG: hypothetical protein O7I93_02230, partial [Gemmatimonadetes bacterium]|nr:hypothetical protein [Gemmatimonadota bacterium]
MTYRDVMDKVKEKVNRYYGTQSPQVEGTSLDQYVFSDESSIAEPYVSAFPAKAGRVTLRAGQVHGMTEGSVFEVYAPGTKTFEPGKGMARVELTKVNPLNAEATILEGGPVPEAARAVEREHQFPDQKLLVHYRGLSASATLKAVKAELDQQGHIQGATEDDSYHLVLYDEGGTIHIEGLDKTVASEPVRAGARAVDAVVEQVQLWAKWFNVLSIDNAAGARLELTIVANAMQGGSRDPFKQPDTYEGVIGDRETVTCIVKNRSKRDLYIALLDISTDGSISVLYPEQEGAAEVLPAGEEFEIEGIEFFVPAGREEVKDVLKVFATSTPIDFNALTQPGIGSRGDGMTDPLGQLLEQATLGKTRGAKRKKVNLGDWVTVQ